MARLTYRDLFWCRRFGVKWKLRVAVLVSILTICFIISILQVLSSGLETPFVFSIPREKLKLAPQNGGHLGLMRHDLDASNYTSQNSRQNQLKYDLLQLRNLFNNSQQTSEDFDRLLQENPIDDSTLIAYVLKDVLRDDTFHSPEKLALLLASVENIRTKGNILSSELPNLFQPHIQRSNEKKTNVQKMFQTEDKEVKRQSSIPPVREKLFPTELGVLKTALKKPKLAKYRLQAKRKIEIYKHELYHK